MKVHKRILMSAMAVIMVASMAAPCAFAAEVKPFSSVDSYPTVNYNGNSFKTGERRTKDNYTPIYFWGRSITLADQYVQVRAIGLHSLTATQLHNLTALSNGKLVSYVTC